MHKACKYTPELAKEICERLANGESLRAICRDPKIPVSDHAVRLWVLKDINGFASQYTQARDLGLDVLADEVLDIADDGRNDWIERENKKTGKTFTALNEEAIARSRIRFDARRWYLSKLAPKRYGERLHQELTGKDGGPIEVVDMTDAQLAAALNALAADVAVTGTSPDDPSDLV